MCGMDRVVNDDVFVALATRPDLSIPEGDHRKAYVRCHELTNQNSSERQPFPQLRQLVCTEEINGLLNLLPHLTQLTRLETTILGAMSLPLKSIVLFWTLVATYCSNLQFLQLEYTAAQDVYLSSYELVKLSQALPRLGHLKISGDHVRAPGIETVHIAKIAEALPRLGLEFQCALTLIEVRKGCGRSLTQCRLWGSHNLSNLEKVTYRSFCCRSLFLKKECYLT
jgi:hypothetical protein